MTENTHDPYQIPPEPTEAPPEILAASKPIWPTIAKFGVGIVISLLVASLFLPARRRVPESARRTQCLNNLTNIGLALHNYQAVHGKLPPAYTVDADGNRLHSWRTLILPYLDRQDVFETIDLQKPWDHPANAQAYNSTIRVYRCPSSWAPANHTNYFALVGPDRCLMPTNGRSLSEIVDEFTVMVTEVPVARACHWMEPTDVEGSFLDALTSTNQLPHTAVTQVVFADGSARAISIDMEAADLEALTTIAGGEDVDSDF